MFEQNDYKKPSPSPFLLVSLSYVPRLVNWLVFQVTYSNLHNCPARSVCLSATKLEFLFCSKRLFSMHNFQVTCSPTRSNLIQVNYKMLICRNWLPLGHLPSWLILFSNENISHFFILWKVKLGEPNTKLTTEKQRKTTLS